MIRTKKSPGRDCQGLHARLGLQHLETREMATHTGMSACFLLIPNMLNLFKPRMAMIHPGPSLSRKHMAPPLVNHCLSDGRCVPHLITLAGFLCFHTPLHRLFFFMYIPSLRHFTWRQHCTAFSCPSIQRWWLT